MQRLKIRIVSAFFSLVIIFEDLAGHDVYQIHSIHKAFLDEFRGLFEKVVIYDAQ